jgi:hypothetical protein
MTDVEFCDDFNDEYWGRGLSVHLVRNPYGVPWEMAFNAEEWNLKNVRAPCKVMRAILAEPQDTWRLRLETLVERA